MQYELLIKQAEAYISKYMQKHANPKLLFHNLQFTKNTVSVATKIIKQYTLEEKDSFIVMAATWFLNAGYSRDIFHPEEASLKIAEEFFCKSGVDIDTIEEIKKCMLAAKTPAVPGQLEQQIIWDANTFYLGSPGFFSYNKLQYKEAELLGMVSIDKSEWKRNMIQLLESHQFYTDYCRDRLNSKKLENLEILRKKNPLLALTPNYIEAIFAKEDVLSEVEYKEQDEKRLKDKKKTKESPERTIETMFRTSSVNSQNLSSQADAKANIMISVNAIIISVLLSVVVRKIDDYQNLILPVILILAVSLVTIIFSILATRPNIKKKNFTETDIKENKINMLFFGNFFTMDFNTYSNAMLRMMNEKNDLQMTLLRNLYEQGIVLAKKYRMLKISYNVFMYGLIVSVITFFIKA
jgi:predicted metal-dependent HD superfamily phosphohydrolase